MRLLKVERSGVEKKQNCTFKQNVSAAVCSGNNVGGGGVGQRTRNEADMVKYSEVFSRMRDRNVRWKRRGRDLQRSRVAVNVACAVNCFAEVD